MFQIRIANLSLNPVPFIALFLSFLPLVCDAGQGVRVMDERDVFKQAHVYHIMFRDRESAEKTLAQLRALPEERRFSAFKEAAKAKSIDVASAKEGGDLGVIANNGIGMIPGDFMKVAFSLPAHSLSGVVQSEFGWHLIYIQSASEEPVKGICKKSLNASIKNSSAEDRSAIDLSRMPYSDGVNFQSSVLEVLGHDWGAPLEDRDGNLFFFRRSSAHQKGLTVVTQDIEYKYAKLNDHGCARSSRKEFIVDCKAPLITWKPDPDVYYELRGGKGRVVLSVPSGAKTSTSVAPKGGYFMRLYDFACGAD